MARPLFLATVGDNCIDRFLPPVGLSAVGGNAVNVAVHLAKAGHRAAYFGAVGDDSAGLRTRSCLAGQGLDLDPLQIIVGGKTAYTDIVTHPGGEREMVFEEFGVCRGYRPNAAERADLFRKRHVHIGWFDDGGALKQELNAAGISVSQDLSVNAATADRSPDHLAIAFASVPRDQATAEIQRLLQAGAVRAVVTCGAQGAMAGEGDEVYAVDALSAEVSDTTGAGDTFIAGFIDAHLARRGLQDCLIAGRDLAAGTCRHFGGFPQQPEVIG